MISEHDNGDPWRKHKKKRIAKKWLKMYGKRAEPLDPGVVIAAVDGTRTMYVSRRTYCMIRMYCRPIAEPDISYRWQHL